MTSTVEEAQNGSLSLDSNENPGGGQFLSTGVNGVVTIEGTDAVGRNDAVFRENDDKDLALQGSIENAEVPQDLISEKNITGNITTIASNTGSTPDDCVPMEDVETPGKRNAVTVNQLSVGSENDGTVTENTDASPEKPNLSVTEVSNNSSLCSDNDVMDAASAEIATSDSQINDSIDISEPTNGHNFPGSHRGAVVPYSDTEDSGSSSSSSSDSDDSDSESTDSDGSDNEMTNCPRNTKTSGDKPIKVPGEIELVDLPPIQDLHISVRNDQVVEIGKVLHVVDTLVVVECFKDQPPLDIDSVLFLDRGARPLGRIFDVMGPVTEPLYSVRFNSKEHVEEHNIQPGMPVYCAPQTEHSNFVFLKHLMMMKGSDASWKGDKEVPSSQVEFSDDEEEAHTRKEMNGNMAVTTMNPEEPKRKVFKLDGPSAYQGCPRGEMSDRPRPRNPWGWSGPRNGNPNYSNQSQPSNQPNQFRSRGPVRPSSFNVDSTFQGRTHRGCSESNQVRYPNDNHYGRESDPRMFSEPLPTAHDEYDSSWCSNSPYENEGNDYTQDNGNTSQCSATQSAEDRRYHAFQSEIARLVDAYTRGAEGPMSVPPPSFNFGSGAPTPPYGSRPHGPPRPQLGLRPPSHTPQLNSRLPRHPPPFTSRPLGTHPQFGSRLPGPHPQFGSRSSGPYSQFGSRPPGPHPQSGSRPPGPQPQFGSRHPSQSAYFGDSHMSYGDYY